MSIFPHFAGSAQEDSILHFILQFILQSILKSNLKLNLELNVQNLYHEITGK